MNWHAERAAQKSAALSTTGDKMPGMKRSRRLVCNSLVALSGLLLAVTCMLWVRSFHVGRFWSHAVEDDEWEVDIWHGELGFSQSTAENGPPQWTPHIFQYQAFPASDWSEGDGRWQRFGLRIDKSASMGIWWRRFSIPLWMPASCFALVLLSSSLMRMRFRQQIGKCITCGYDLRATPDRCPECGAVPPEKIKNSKLTHYRKRSILAGVAGGVLVVAAVCVVVAILVRPNANTFLKRVGVPLPANATDVQADDSSGWDGGEYWMSAKLSQTDFLAMTKAAALERDPKILQQYPGVFVRRPDAPAWWTSSELSEKDIYFASKPDGYVAACYENGRVYLRRSTY